MSNTAIRITNLMVSLFVNDNSPSHSILVNANRPPLGGNLYNPSETETVTIVIPPKTRAYLPGLFANEKYGSVLTNITKTHFVAKLPLGSHDPAFKSGKIGS